MEAEDPVVDAGAGGDAAPGGTDADAGAVPDVGFDAGSTMDLGADAGLDIGLDAGADAGPDDLGPADAGAPVDPLVGRGAVELVADGFVFVEGPRWFEGRLVFSDIPASTIYEVDAAGAVSVFLQPSGGSNGLAVDSMGRLLLAEHEGRRVSRLAGGTRATVVESYMGQSLNSPNDLCVRSDGTLYFTDPEWGIVGDLSVRELDVNGVYRVDASGAIHLEHSVAWTGHGSTPRPNGVVLSADETRLYVGNDLDAELWVFDVASDGALSGPVDTWTTRATPDGMAMDLAGNIYVGTADGVQVFDPSGAEWGLIPIANASNVAFGGDDARTLFVTAEDAVHSVRLASPGLR